MPGKKSVATPLLALPRPVKRLFVIAIDLTLSLISVWVAFYLRIDQTGLPQLQQNYVYLLAPLLAIPVFVRFGLYRAIFRYTGMAALATTAKAVGLYTLLFFSALLWFKWEGVPRTLGLIQPLLLLMLVGTSRALARFWLAGWSRKGRHSAGRLLIYGAGEAGVQTASAIAVTRQFVLLGFVDDDNTKAGRTINGVDIMRPDEVTDAVDRMGVTDVLLAMPSLGRSRRNEIIASLRDLPVHIRTLPGMVDLASGRVSAQDFQELDVEDLLGRPPVLPDATLLAKNLAGQVVLVTGAGGSIGSELCRQIIFAKPHQLVLVDHNEFGLYTAHRELEALCQEHALPVAITPLLASVVNFSRLQEIFQLYKPASVYHAAAYKHVPLVESNPAEGVLNNIFGTFNVARAAMESSAAHFVLISTDKAVRPTNVMGATKRIAELVLQAFSAISVVNFLSPDGGQSHQVFNATMFSMVRFGNVLGSSGSVVPLFRKQLASGGPLTLTHEEVTRYFMTIPEAAQLVLQAGAMATGGEVFVLDMGQPVKIIDLAKRMIQLEGLSILDDDNPHGDIAINVTGLRPGEKLYEELLIGDGAQPTAHTRILKAHEDFVVWSELSVFLAELRNAAMLNDAATIKLTLTALVSGYTPADQICQSTPIPMSISQAKNYLD